MVQKYASDCLGQEEDMSFKHKAPFWLTHNIMRVGWFLSIHYMVIFTFYLGEQHKIFNTISVGARGDAFDPVNLPINYEDLYFVDGGKKW